MNKMQRLFPLMVLVAFTALSSITVSRCVAAEGGANTELGKKLVGMWVLISRSDGTEISGAGSRVKVFTGGHWIVTEAHFPDGRVTAHHGGSYSLAGDVLTTTTDYALPSMMSLVGVVRQFRITVDGDVYTQTGLGNPYSEVWQRLKEPAQ